MPFYNSFTLSWKNYPGEKEEDLPKVTKLPTIEDYKREQYAKAKRGMGMMFKGSKYMKVTNPSKTKKEENDEI